MDRDQILRTLDDLQRRVRRLEEAEAGRVVAGASSKGAVVAPEWATATAELCSVCGMTPGIRSATCADALCPYRGNDPLGR